MANDFSTAFKNEIISMLQRAPVWLVDTSNNKIVDIEGGSTFTWTKDGAVLTSTCSNNAVAGISKAYFKEVSSDVIVKGVGLSDPSVSQGAGDILYICEVNPAISLTTGNQIKCYTYGTDYPEPVTTRGIKIELQ